MATKTGKNNKLLIKNKRILFFHNKKSVSLTFLLENDITYSNNKNCIV